MPSATMALVRGLMGYDAPRTYEQIFADIDSSQVVLVSGEQDNTFTPGGGGDPTPTWEGLNESGSLARADAIGDQKVPHVPLLVRVDAPRRDPELDHPGPVALICVG